VKRKKTRRFSRRVFFDLPPVSGNHPEFPARESMVQPRAGRPHGARRAGPRAVNSVPLPTGVINEAQASLTKCIEAKTGESGATW
jgi:hypothetical protein